MKNKKEDKGKSFYKKQWVKILLLALTIFTIVFISMYWIFQEIKLILVILGLAFNFLGSLCLAKGLFITEDRAIELSVPRAGGGTREDDLARSDVKEKLNNKKWAKSGAVLFSLGFIFQIISKLI